MLLSNKLAGYEQKYGDLIALYEISEYYPKGFYKKSAKLAADECDINPNDAPHALKNGNSRCYILYRKHLHPEVRRKGKLAQHWPYFVETYGNFQAQPPISPSMTCFLKKQWHPIA